MSTVTEMQINHEAISKKFNEIMAFTKSAATDGRAVHEIEQGLWEHVLALGGQMMQMFFSSLGDGDEGEEVRMPDGRVLKRLVDLHTRPYLSIFGNFELQRAVYGTRERQKIEYVPLDARLQLPKGKFSYVLQEWNHSFALEMPFAQVSSLLERMLGFKQSVNSLERSNRWCAENVEEFWKDIPVPVAKEEGELLVCSADGKGVPMRRNAESKQDKPIELTSGMRPGDKKMGLVGAVYTVDRYPRTPEQIVDALFRTGEKPMDDVGRPKPCFKHVRAALKRDFAGTTEPQVKEIFGWIAQEAEQRGRSEQKQHLVLLMDGQLSLWDAGYDYLPVEKFEVVEILDLLHAAAYVWKAVHLFYPSNSLKAAKLARKQLSLLVSGKLEQMIRSFLGKANRDRLSKQKRSDLRKIIGYFRGNAERMQYADFLAAGYPIASGIIEGACRTVVKDRMERAGMRWVFDGAHAMMGLRSIHLSALWNDFLAYRIGKEQRRLYLGNAANYDLSPILSAA